VKNYEVYYDQSDGLNNNTFAYTTRYNEYRTMYSRACGEFRTALDYWLGIRKFTTRPQFNEVFQSVIPDAATLRIFATTTSSDPHILSQVHHGIHVSRKLPLMVTPSI
jgi:hypothetical protein